MYCVEVERYFTERGIPHINKDIRRDPEARQEWSQRFNGDIVPMVVFDDGKRIVDGYDIPAIERVLRELTTPHPPSLR